MRDIETPPVDIGILQQQFFAGYRTGTNWERLDAIRTRVTFLDEVLGENRPTIVAYRQGSDKQARALCDGLSVVLGHFHSYLFPLLAEWDAEKEKGFGCTSFF